jgi:uncharacterized protein YjeT (DUF2065 family)
MVLKTILYTFGIIALIEGLVISLFPNNCKRIVIKTFKKKDKIRNIGIIESILALIIIFIAAVI